MQIYIIFISPAMIKLQIKNQFTTQQNLIQNMAYNYPYLYAQNCPQQPTILQQQVRIQDQFYQNSHKNKHRQAINFQYKSQVIKSKKYLGNSINQFYQLEHKRQLNSLHTRINNCKSLSQRKKDHNDPIVYPIYFIRDNRRIKDVIIDRYKKKIMQLQSIKLMNLSKSSKDKVHKIKVKQNNYRPKQKFSQSPIDSTYSMECKQQVYLPLPIINNANIFQRSTKRQTQLPPKLPECNIRSILQFITNESIWAQSDLKILNARLRHYYGEIVEELWKQVMYNLHKNGY